MGMCSGYVGNIQYEDAISQGLDEFNIKAHMPEDCIGALFQIQLLM